MFLVSKGSNDILLLPLLTSYVMFLVSNGSNNILNASKNLIIFPELSSAILSDVPSGGNYVTMALNKTLSEER